ncbi:MAG TPA: hypothetical protein DDX39_08080 [Bacteroidales bacterium]|nr:MAG: hypothetical protein A2W98_14875 [Bacteroidetes bacterium GWF2_33_38]OFY91333.1 MAG: hypothetical protein A2236_13780 [Bacteroidetes bacterium RIFOXYA2_FULL_33_7]HBF88585.1 hypothetical protein [Bacteroidales bacterium]
MKKIIFLVSSYLIFSFAFIVNAQNKINSQNAINWTFKEKIKYSPEQLKKMSENSETKPNISEKSTKSINSNGEVNVSDNDKIEAEIHAAINPIDSNNIIISPILNDMSTMTMYCPVYYTSNFGDSWQLSSFKNMPYASGTISMGGGDPVFAYDGNGRAYMSWIDLYGSFMVVLMGGTVDMGIFWAYSDDGGNTWVQPERDTVLLGQVEIAGGALAGVVSPISDKQWMAVDMSESSVNKNNLYVSYVTISEVNDTAKYQILCKTKPANSDYFTHEAAVSLPDNFPFVQFSSVCVDLLGNVHVTFYGSNDGYSLSLFHAVSENGGISFSTPNKISNVRFNLPIFQVQPYDLIAGIDTSRLYPSPYCAASTVNNDIYITWTAFGTDSLSGNDGADIYFSKSSDNGTTWSTPIIINDDAQGLGTHNYYSSIFVKQNGEIKISWYDRRNDVNNIKAHYYYATSEDSGVTFDVNRAASTTETDFSTVGSQNSNFGIGEYTQVLASENYTIPVWCDGRSGDGYLQVYASFINDLTVEVEKISMVSEDMAFISLFPNPISDVTSVTFSLNKTTVTNIGVYDIAGKLVKPLLGKEISKGKHTLDFNLQSLSKGKYYIVIQNDLGMTARPFVKL